MNKPINFSKTKKKQTKTVNLIGYIDLIKECLDDGSSFKAKSLVWFFCWLFQVFEDCLETKIGRSIIFFLMTKLL